MSHSESLTPSTMTSLTRLCLDTPTSTSHVTSFDNVVNVVPITLDFNDDDSRDSGFESQGSDSEETQDNQPSDEIKPTFFANCVKRPLFSGKRSHSFLEDCSPSKRVRNHHISDSSNTNVTSDIMKSAVDKMECEQNLIGDGSKSHSLPIVTGRHKDLKSVAPHTVSQLLQGAYSDFISGYQIVDCRYPYEYEGGHIEGAVNLVDEYQIEKLLTSQSGDDSTERNVLIFHCEFSSERGPKLLRHLRSIDRKLNSDRYPLLTFPEVYLMEGGYKAFFDQHQSQCEPSNYRPMLHENFTSELRNFRSRSKSSKTRKHQKRSGRNFLSGVSPLKCSLW